MTFRRVIVLLSLVTLGAGAPLWAAETGSISGSVYDKDGNPVEGALVRVSGDLLPAGRTITTAGNGLYRFPVLLPGTYLVEASKQELGANARTVAVEVDKDSQLDLVLGLQVQEELTVTGSTPVVDMKSTEVGYNYQNKVIESLPLERSYRGLFQLIPGVADPSSSNGNGLAPAAGGSRQDNIFLVDGVNVTNPGSGSLSSEVNELDLQEFNVKRGAITAEFGRASGFVTNAVTRSGTNSLTGTFRFEVQPKQFNAQLKDPILQERVNRYAPAFAGGGPIIKDKLFWYASGRFARSTTTDRGNLLGPVHDRVDRANEILAKITAQPGSSYSISGSFRHRPTSADYASIGLRDSDSVASNAKGKTQMGNLAFNWFPASRSVVEVKYLHMIDQNNSLPLTDLGFRPTWNPSNLAAMGNYDDGTVITGSYYLRTNRTSASRNEVKAALTQYLDLGRTSHQIKAGFGRDNTLEDLTYKSNGWGLITMVDSGTHVQARYYPDQPTQRSRGTTYSLFVQDDITIGKRVVINAGLLMNRDEYAQEAPIQSQFLTFNFSRELQPRLGINYNLRRGAGDKIYANFGRYYSLDQKSSARSMAPGRLYTNDAIFDRATGVLLDDRPGVNTTGKVIDPNVDPTYGDEFLVGYATPLKGTWGIDAFYLHRSAHNFIEDQPRVLPASSFWYSNVANAKRTYQAFTIEVSRRLANRWSMTTSYGWSRLWGNFDLDYDGSGYLIRQGGVFNTSSYIEDGPGCFVEDQYRTGVLAQDRPHVFKVFTSYEPIAGVTLGGFLRSQSGVPFVARGRDWYNGYLRYLEPAGSHRNDFWTNVDLLASYRWRFASRAAATIEARVLNLFNTQTALYRDQRQYLDGRNRAFSGTPTPGNPASYTALMIQDTTQPNPRFGAATDYAQPTRFVLTFLLSY